MEKYHLPSGDRERIVMLSDGRSAVIRRTNCGEADSVVKSRLDEEVLDGFPKAKLTIETEYTGVYGMGEKYNGLNQKGRTAVNQVIEHFCRQDEYTYLQAPFFVTNTGFGIYVDTDKKTVFQFGETIVCEIPQEAEVYVFTGTVEEIISAYMKMFGPAKLPPKYAFGIWASANHWNTQKHVEYQLQQMEKYNFPADVLVLEAWSDEATFYIWNGAQYEPKKDGGILKGEDFDYSESAYWKNPKAMIEELHKKNIHLVLWQIPVYKAQPKEEVPNEQLRLDTEDAVRRGLCVKNEDGTPYRIPEGHWFEHSVIPDYTREDTKETWFAKRQYLLDMGVDGFKTDGGEFIYREDVRFANGMDGTEGKNAYAQLYTEAYSEKIGADRVLFSRAGSRGAHRMPIHWAGDQQSENGELRGVLSAGLSAAMTGIPFWSFDIGGFAGPLPSADLYRRATKLGCFIPVMQYHSEPDGGQFRDLLPGGEGNNERTPWNIANVWKEPELIDEARYYHNLHRNLVPYIYSEAKKCCKSYRPMMRPLVYEWPEISEAVQCEDEYLLGESLLVAPLLEENASKRDVWLPDGEWYGFFSHKKYSGGKADSELEHFPVYIRSGCGIALEGCAREGEGIRSGTEEGIHFLLAGEEGTCCFEDEYGEITVRWKDGQVELQTEDRNDWNITWEFIQ